MWVTTHMPVSLLRKVLAECRNTNFTMEHQVG